MGNVTMEKLVVTNENKSTYHCKGDIPGARPVNHVITEGSELILKANMGYYHILVLIDGIADFMVDGKTYTHDNDRTTFIPALDKELVIKAKSLVQVLEIEWDVKDGDLDMIKEYNTAFPVDIPYVDSIQYIDPNKSQKTISRMMIPQRIIPRFSMGSVESYGYDAVKAHAHPMLDQFFCSFPENKSIVSIDDVNNDQLGNEIFHIPLGSKHGVEVVDDNHLHYMWIDFMPDNSAGLARLDASHKPTGLNRSFEEERKAKNN